MTEKLIKLIDKLKSIPHLVTFDEAATKQFVVLPILHALGWDTQSINEVRPEFPIENKKVDFSLHANSRLFFLEVKKISEDLVRHEKQLLEYSFLHGIEFAVLTNGIHWWFYLPMKKCDWQSRKFATADIFQQDGDSVVQKFSDLLAKDNADTLGNAEAHFRAKRITDTLPLAWNKLISQSDSSLFARLSEITIEICGYRPEPSEILPFIEKHADRLLVPFKEKERRITTETSVSRRAVTEVLNIAQLLDAILSEYMKQGKCKSSSENITKYSHSDYPLEVTVRKSPVTQSEFDKIEIIASSKQLVNAFEKYCKTYRMKNSYTSGSIFAARLRTETDELAKTHWELIAKNGSVPYFKTCRGSRYWKLVKTV